MPKMREKYSPDQGNINLKIRITGGFTMIPSKDDYDNFLDLVRQELGDEFDVESLDRLINGLDNIVNYCREADEEYTQAILIAKYLYQCNEHCTILSTAAGSIFLSFDNGITNEKLKRTISKFSIDKNVLMVKYFPQDIQIKGLICNAIFSIS